MHFWIDIALSYNASFTLLQVSRPPWTVQVMEGNEAVLNVHPSAHFEGTSHKNAHLSRTNFRE